MKMLTRATKDRFTPLLEKVPEYLKEKFSRDRLELRTQIREDGVPNTIMELYSMYPDDPNKHRDVTRLTYNFPSRLFEKRYMREGMYNVPLTDSNVELIFATWPLQQIRLDYHSRRLCTKVLAAGIRQDKNADIVSRYKELKEVPVPANGNGYLEVKDATKALTPYQKVARHILVNSDSLCMYFKQGTGKTPTTISAIVNDCLAQNRDFYRAVIICPKNVRFNWVEEIKHFCPLPHKSTIIKGSRIDREVELVKALLPEDNKRISFVIASYGALRTTEDAFTLKKVLEGLIPVGEELKWDFAVLDESHYIKSPRAQRTQSAFKLRDASRKRAVLTGTPIANSLFDLWAQWEFCDKYLSGFSNFSAFRDFHSEAEKERGRSGRRDVKVFANVPLLQERLARTSMIVTKEEALPDLPEKMYDTIEVSMTKEQASVYERVLNDIMLEAEQELADSERPREMMVNNILVKMLRLAQVTSGFITWDAQYNDEGEETLPQTIDRLDPNPKLEELVSCLKEKEEFEKTIVWACFHQDISTIKARLDLEEIDSVVFHGGTTDEKRKIAEHRFNCDPTCKVFIGNPAAGGTGLNLLGYDYRQQTDNEDARLTNCNHIIYYSQNWSLTARSQSEDRAHRRGTRTHVRISDLMIPASIDQQIRDRVTEKINISMSITDLRRILESIANPQTNGTDD